jgi:membrane protease YdiL (CAAX protease family)
MTSLAKPVSLLKPALTFLALWGLSTAYLALKGADWTFPIAALLIFGTLLSAIAYWLTRRAPVIPATSLVERPPAELKAILVYLAIYALVMLGWALGAVREAVAAGPEQEIAVLALKLVVHVAIPVAIIVALKGRLAPMFASGHNRQGFWPALVVIGAMLLGLLSVVSPSLKQIGALEASPLAIGAGFIGAFIWVAVEAGFNEEFLFRAVLQTRLSAVLGSESWAIVWGSIIFALAHAPGLYLRGTPETDGWSTDPLQVAAFTIATLAPISILFGVLWARTRSLLLVVLLHGSVDALPFTSEFMTTWGIG